MVGLPPEGAQSQIVIMRLCVKVVDSL